MMNGYSVEEVDDFLDEIGADYAKKYKELKETSKTIEDLNNELVHYKNIEGTLQNTLVMAQKTAEEVKQVAKQQAEQIITDAKSTAQKELNNINEQITTKKRALNDLQKQFDIYRVKMESLLYSQLELIKEINKEN